MKTVYHEFSAEVPSLDQHHFDMLRHGSGISVDVIKERGGFTVIDKRVLADLGFNRKQQQLCGLALPVHTPDGNPPSLYVLRPDTRRVVRGKEMKYEFPPRTSMRIDVPPRCLEGLKNPMIPLWITEGQKKADALASHGLCAIALLGVWNFKGKNKFDSLVKSLCRSD